MKDYERLTERDEFGNADIIGVDSEILAGALDFDGLNKLTSALNNFADLEDKIESGELDYVADRKTEQTITDLLIEFDEMGFAPTTVCPNAEQYAIDWRERARKEFARLTVKNAELRETLSKMETVEKELRERLDNAVELPCKIGDTIYYIEYFCNYKGCSHNAQLFCCGCKEMIERERNNNKYVICEKAFELKDLYEIGKKYFTDRAEVESRIAVLKGGRNEYL